MSEYFLKKMYPKFYSKSKNEIKSPINSTITTDSLDEEKPSYNFLSKIEEAILRSLSPIKFDETEEITVLGEKGLWVNKSETQNWTGEIPLDKYEINHDLNPEIIKKKNPLDLNYIQELAVRYLKPPTPEAPGDIIIKYENNSYTKPAPPIIIRQQPPRPKTPEPIVIREAPPPPPKIIGKKVITISGQKLPPQPRKVIIERLAEFPPKPQSILIERWLPYKPAKRKVILQKSDETSEPQKPKNLIIEWQPPKLTIKREVKYLGIVRADPKEYENRYGKKLISSQNMPDYAKEIIPPSGLKLAANTTNSVPKLEGDLEALRLIDLDKEGLSDYKPQLEQDFNKTGSKFLDLQSLNIIFNHLDKNSDGKINIEDARHLICFLNEYLNKMFSNIIIDQLVQLLPNQVTFVDFKNIYEKFFI